jgi:hypothetical protein
MNVAIGIGALLLGGWVLGPPVDELPQNAPQEPATTTAPIIPPDQATRRLPAMQTPAAKPGAEPYRRYVDPGLPNMPSDRRRGTSATAGQQADRSGAGILGGMPVAPTEPDPSSIGRASGWVPPTATGQIMRGNRMASAVANREAAANTAWARMPAPPTARTVDTTNAAVAATPPAPIPPGYGMGPYATSISAFAVPQPLPEKPFAAYRSMPGVSPYLNLFRNDTSLGTIDNYTTLVRPQLEQRFLNQQIRREVYGLERNSRAQGAALQQIEGERAPQGIATPQFYLNYGNYYPAGPTPTAP